MIMDDKYRRIIKIAISISSLLAFCFVISPIFVPKWDTKLDNYVGTNLRGFYAEPDDSIDVLYIGNSTVFCGVSPMDIWKDQKITGYNIAVGSAHTWTEYYWLKEALNRQSPKAVVIAAESFYYDDEIGEPYNRKALDNMWLSWTKMEALFSGAFDNTAYDDITYLFPVLRYHERWKELGKNDVLLAYSPCQGTITKGYDLYKEIKPYTDGYDYLKNNSKSSRTGISDKSMEYLEKIIDLCEEKKIQLILTTIPSVEVWSIEANKNLQDFCTKNDIKYFGINDEEVMNNIGFDWLTDTCDQGKHLNYNGAKKVSKYLGKIVKAEIGNINHTDEVMAIWNSALINYEKMYSNKEG